ncbi:c-type cytochrome biogenesis protein CcmI [Microbulbifer harenosus]|uniref:C-type cytochrome biogenesis protein CcmI n=1 Tax=Microbulbifer harenosus TaxID=2576840 RepID=A0ABY2UKF1_9GAMM|nr:c-type cytochrome biogenesis protein CcmI [Microbulbifer harenosus]TLM78761.1 c-type cytochrome biogenesis protein CcmI [Microbulbifer harenosus]
MIDLWLILALLLLPLAAIIAWPLLRSGGLNSQGADGSADTRTLLYREHLAELDAAHLSGAVDEAQYQSLKTELARKLLSEEGGGYQLTGAQQGGRSLLYALAVLVPLAAVGLYAHWGFYDDLALYRDIAASHTGETDRVTEARITQQLSARAGSHPEDLTSRYVLAQRLLVSNDIEGAVNHYRYIVAHEPEAANVRAELAQALFFASGSQMTPEVVKEVDLVLAVQPDNTTALGLAGIAAFEREDFAAARAHWQHALAQMPAGSSAAQALSAGVARAERALADAGGEQSQRNAHTEPAVTSAPGATEVAAGENRIVVKVTLSDGIQHAPDTPVFIYARTSASPMPLAIVRLTAAELPVEVVLDESKAMMPGSSLKTVDEVQLVARLAISGGARPAPGDWQGAVERLPRSDWAEPVHITIDQEI